MSLIHRNEDSCVEPDNKGMELLKGAALLAAIFGALMIFLGRYFTSPIIGFDFFYDSKGACALNRLQFGPWLILLGMISARNYGFSRKSLRFFGVMAVISALILAFDTLCSSAYFLGPSHVRWPHRIDYFYQDNIYKVLRISCNSYVSALGRFMEVPLYLSLGVLSNGCITIPASKSVCLDAIKVLVPSCALLFICEHFLFGKAVEMMEIPFTVASVLSVISVFSAVAVSISIVRLLCSGLAFRVVSVKWLRIVLVILSIFPWLFHATRILTVADLLFMIPSICFNPIIVMLLEKPLTRFIDRCRNRA